MTGETANVWAIVPAAGQARRFAGSKLLVQVGGRSLLAYLLDSLDAARVADVVVVVNPAVAPAIQAERPATHRRRYALNTRPDSEMIESIQMGLRTAREQCGPHADNAGFLVCPGDHPCVSRPTIDACISVFESSPQRLVLATHGGRNGHPLIIPADLAATILEWPAHEGLNRLRHRCQDRLTKVELPDPGILIDIDTPADLEQALQHLPRLKR